jgi:hypothetical protein
MCELRAHAELWYKLRLVHMSKTMHYPFALIDHRL